MKEEFLQQQESHAQKTKYLLDVEKMLVNLFAMELKEKKFAMIPALSNVFASLDSSELLVDNVFARN